MPGPVFGVDGVVDDRGIEPQPVTLFAVVEGCFERRTAAASAPAAATSAAATRGIALGVIASLGGFLFPINGLLIILGRILVLALLDQLLLTKAPSVGSTGRRYN